MWSVPRRRSESSTAVMIQRREGPRRLTSSPIGMKNFVARTTSSRRPLSALPTISSDSPAEYTSAVSGLRDVAAEGLERDVLGLGAAAPAGVEAGDGGELLGGELEVEDVEVLGDALGLGGLRDHRAAVLQAPAQHDL